jgi:hypothetical protein
MISVRIARDVKEDVAGVFSRYPNGLDPAPLVGAGAGLSDTSEAAAKPSEGGAAAAHGMLLRVRPKGAEPASLRVLELGRIGPDGVFTPLEVLSEGKPYADLAMTADSAGSLWILYGDATASWLERRICDEMPKSKPQSAR